ncbi:MAG: hypothetical protein Q9180_004767, partial [Flavoplaca navasiana]
MASMHEGFHQPRLSFPKFLAALFLIKIKAPDVSVQDYLAKLRSHVRTGHRPELETNGARYVDTLDFWKDSFHQLQNQMNEQKARVYALERELDLCKATRPQSLSEQTGKKAPPAISRNKKRKRASLTDTQSESNGQQDLVDLMNTVTDPLNARGFGLSGRGLKEKSINCLLTLPDPQLSDAIYALRKSFSAPSIEPGIIASIILFTISTIRSWAYKPTSISASDSNGSNALAHPSSRMTVPQADTIPTTAASYGEDRLTPATAGIIIHTIISAIDKFSATSTHQVYQQQCIYAVVKLLKDILDHICQLASTSNVGTQAPEPPTKPPTKKPRRSARVRGENPPSSSIINSQQEPPVQTPSNSLRDDHKQLTSLITFLIAAIQRLYANDMSTQPTSKTIQEGWMFCLLQRISDTLKTFVFGEDDEAWLMIHPDTKGDGIVQSSKRKRKPNEREDQERAKKQKEKEKQAPYLILLLEKST